ncbi:peptidylprolyl isomerase [Propionivibrio sp.]|uniref:peptidylprolyl isomerase n=1 Tax=Propionivibrio sp. TaxID=2212460 RepID=UPI003BF1D196
MPRCTRPPSPNVPMLIIQSKRKPWSVPGFRTETPVKTEFGYHVILLEDSRPLNVPPFDEIKPRLLQQAQSQQINKMVEALRAKAKID